MIFRNLRARQFANIEIISRTLKVSKPEASNEDNEEHPENIFDILVTLEVSKPCRSIDSSLSLYMLLNSPEQFIGASTMAPFFEAKTMFLILSPYFQLPHGVSKLLPSLPFPGCTVSVPSADSSHGHVPHMPLAMLPACAERVADSSKDRVSSPDMASALVGRSARVNEIEKSRGRIRFMETPFVGTVLPAYGASRGIDTPPPSLTEERIPAAAKWGKLPWALAPLTCHVPVA